MIRIQSLKKIDASKTSIHARQEAVVFSDYSGVYVQSRYVAVICADAASFIKLSLLGLCLSKHIAKLLGGDLLFEPGKDELWFEVRLPRQI